MVNLRDFSNTVIRIPYQKSSWITGSFVSELFRYSNQRKYSKTVQQLHQKLKIDTEAKRRFATHDEDIDYFNMRIYIILITCVYIQQFNFVQ